MTIRNASLGLAILVWGAAFAVVAAPEPSRPLYDCYEPVQNGWHVRLGDHPDAERPERGSRIGVISANDGYNGNGRLHRRPLYPPADRTLLFTNDEMAKLERCTFRPLVLAYNEPRFLFDYHSAGGLLGHLYLGMTTPAASKWFHQWKNLDVSYVDGRMLYAIDDPDFPGVTVRLEAAALADAVGLITRIEIEKAPAGSTLIWAYGGASAWFTNWAMNAKQFDYAPEQCAKNTVSWNDGAFTLTRGFDKSDVIMNEVFAVARRLPEWRIRIQGGMGRAARSGYGDPGSFAATPAALTKTADWNAAAEKTDCVAVQELPLNAGGSVHHLAVGAGGNMAEAIRNPKAAWKAALERNESIAKRIVTHTPDPYLDAAMPMMAFATEGTWGDVAVVHGGWSWRFAYLGWRTQYGMNCYGWSDRTRKSIANHIRLNRVSQGPDTGALGSMIEYDPGVFYNMNEVFLDEVRHYFDYTNDLELMREIYPALKGIVEWENRRLRPTKEPLFENALNTWISDQHWYTRAHCTQASAYMLQANTLLADLAIHLGEDPEPFAKQARDIRFAMQRTLWMEREGVFAEYKDTLGNQLLHTEPELPTLYHAAEFGAASVPQIEQMLYWADTHLRQEATPGGGRVYWSSNWYPNMARSYTHSTYELAYAEELNFALTNYLVGRADTAYAIQRACLAGIFNGPTPGGLSCHLYVDGRQRANDEFADASSMWGRTVVEGLFGIVPKRPEGVVELTPQFPSDWSHASIETPLFSYKWTRADGKITIDWLSPVNIMLSLRQPIRATRLLRLYVNGREAACSLESGTDLTWVAFETTPAQKGLIEIVYAPRPAVPATAVTVKQGDELRTAMKNTYCGNVHDLSRVLGPTPFLVSGVLQSLVSGDPGLSLLLVDAGTEYAPYETELRLQVDPRTPAPAARVWAPPVLPDRDLNRWALVDLSKTYNASVMDAMKRVWDAVKPPPAPASEINTVYYKDHLVEPFVSPKPSDAAWRAKVGTDGIGWTTDGIPFKSVKEGANIGVVTRAGTFPDTIEFPVNAQGKTLYLMISGTTFAMQSHVVNLRVMLFYADGARVPLDLKNPTDIADCWNQYRYHDCAANGFENLGGRSGPAGSAAAGDLTKPVPVDTEAHLVAFELRPDVPLQSVRMEAVANDVVFGVMGATVLK